jgi:hypothetical protein
MAYVASFISLVGASSLMRVAKWPFVAFKESMEKAQALALVQQSLNRFLTEGPEGMMKGYAAELGDALKQFVGFDLFNDFINPLIKDISGELATKYAGMIPQNFTPPDEQAAEKAAEKVVELAEPVIAVMKLQGQTLLEQAVVLGVTAYETYIDDTVETVLRLNAKLVDRFTPELKGAVGWERLKKHGKDLKETTTAIILEEYNALDLAKVKKLFQRLADIEDVFGDDATRKAIRKFIEHRHIIVHRAGKVDRKFQTVTKSRQARGTIVELTTTYVVEGLETLSRFVGNLQAQMEARATGGAESEPPD